MGGNPSAPIIVETQAATRGPTSHERTAYRLYRRRVAACRVRGRKHAHRPAQPGGSVSADPVGGNTAAEAAAAVRGNRTDRIARLLRGRAPERRAGESEVAR